MNFKLKLKICIVFIFILKVTSLFSQFPNAPVLHGANLTGTGSNTRFNLLWSMNPADTNGVLKFKIYKANFYTNYQGDCGYFATVFRNGNDTMWSTQVNPIYVGNYSFYVTAVRTISGFDYESFYFLCNIVQARFKHGHVDVNFTTTPPTIGAVGTQYQYNADAIASDPAPVNYVLNSAPNMMTVDFMTGQIQWTPTVRGRYDISLNAFLNFMPIDLADKGNSDGTLSDEILIDTSDCDKDQLWRILVKSCNEPTYFSGTVVDEIGDTIRNGLVTAYSFNNIDIDSIYYGQIRNDGRYTVEVFEGAYKLSIEGSAFIKEWNRNKTSMFEADSVNAPCGRTTPLDWVVKRIGPDTITFAYDPITVDLLGNQYFFNGFAVSSSGREVRYHLVDGPQGMSVDPQTGLLNWTPSQIGRYYISLKAYLLDDSVNSFAYKNFYLQIRSCIQDSYVKGIVRDSADNEIKQGNVTIHSDGGIDSIGIYNGRINPDGSFLVKIDEGNCKIYLDGEGFYSQWYDNKLLKDSADVVPCPCGDTTDVNVLVYKTPPLSLTITSSPSTNIIVGNLYSYNPVVTGNEGRTVRYMLVKKPIGMTINNQTGVIQWSPNSIGGYKVILKAYLFTDSANSFVLQEWWIKVRSCSTDTYINGIVRDEFENLIPTGTIRVTSESGIDPLGYYTGNIINGNYRVLIDEGRCKVFAEGPTFRGEWFEDKTTEQTATSINVPCGTTASANFYVRLFKNYIISGKVTDNATGSPVVNAKVFFQSLDSLDSVTTNLTGDYSISLYEGNSYIAWAIVPQNPLLITQYYDLTGNITEATPVEFSGNLSNINFALKSASLTDNRMYGTVESIQGEPIKSIVINHTLFPADTLKASMFDARTDITDVDGNYEFLNLAEGDYLLQAIPYSERYVPGYFKKDSTAVSSWVDASKIKIFSGEQSGPHIITLPETTPTNGKGRISGIITGDQLPSFLKNDDNPLALEAVSGAVVITVDKDEKVRKYNLSNSKGVYRLDSLEAGDYNVSIDKLGYGPYSFDITIDPDNQTHNSDAELDIQIPVGVLDDLTNFTNYFRIYPNPSDGQFNIHSDIDLSGTDILLTNLFGQPIFIQVIELNNYLYTLKIKADDVSQGLFFLRIVNNGISYFRTVVILK